MLYSLNSFDDVTANPGLYGVKFEPPTVPLP